MRVMTKDLKPKTDYYLTFDYWPHGGKRVRLEKKDPAKTVLYRARGEAAIMKDAEGNTYLIHPKAWLFSMPVDASHHERTT